MTAAELRLRWHSATVAGTWSRPLDWWVPEVDALVEATVDGRDPAAACAELGRARANGGVGLVESLDDLEALSRVMGTPAPPVRLVRVLAEAWSEEGVDPIRLATYEDPLSGLSSAMYLRTRLSELYRSAGSSAPDYVLVVVKRDVQRRAGWPGLVRRMSTGQQLRAVFGGGETLASISPSTVIVLAPRSPDAHRSVSELRGRLPAARVWVEGLPERLQTAYAQLDDLSR